MELARFLLFIVKVLCNITCNQAFFFSGERERKGEGGEKITSFPGL